MSLKTFIRRAWNLWRGRCEHYKIDCTWGANRACFNSAIHDSGVCAEWTRRHTHATHDDLLPQIEW